MLKRGNVLITQLSRLARLAQLLFQFVGKSSWASTLKSSWSSKCQQIKVARLENIYLPKKSKLANVASLVEVPN